ncbi:MAG TPA: DUF92 domain-containing protein [Candidatus Kapabacteria bacterium]|nr:DUF92 domain-containing protein [Candidatus Kapabacteria bacterium]
MNFLIGYGGALIIAIFAYVFRSLSKSGAVAAVIIGGTIFAFGGYSASLLLIVFFISGSLLSRLNEKHAGARNWRQVSANGIVPMFAILLLYLRHDLRPEATLLYLGALATATADTWATEIGMRYGGTVHNILSFSKMKKGLSGGVTLVGIAASLGGALLISLLSMISIGSDEGLCGLIFVPVWLVIPIAGLCGSLIDSVVGAAFQAKFMLVSGEIVEENHRYHSELASGIKWLGNNATNLIATTLGALLAVGIANWF